MIPRKKGIKIVILGSADSGKTTTIAHILKSRKEKVTKIESKGTTVAFDYGNIIHNGEKLHIFATPGQERFQFMREILSNGLDGAILVIDNSKGITSTDINIMEKLNSTTVPYVIFCNKQDIAWGKIESPYIKENVKIVPTIARTGEGIKEGLETLLGLMD
jgi:small GTP-binding protein